MRFFKVLLLISGIAFSGYAQIKKDTSENCSYCKIRVIVFLGLDCPISQKYIGKLNDFQESYKGDLEILGFVPQEVSPKAIRAFIKEYNVKFSLQKDISMSLAKRLNAQITPEVFVYPKGIFEKGEVSRYSYSGAIDNWFYALGQYRREVTEFYLKEAIEALLKNEEPVIKRTEAIGCFIQLPPGKSLHDHHR